MISAQWVLSSVMNCWHQSYILSLWTEDKGGLSRKRIVTWEKQGGQPLSNIQHGLWQVVGLSCWSEWIILSTEVNLCLLGKGIASSKFCLGRTCISITMKFINHKWSWSVSFWLGSDFSIFFLRILSRALLLPVSNRTCWAKSSSCKTYFNLDRENRTVFWNHVLWLESVVNPISDRNSWQLNPIFPILFVSVIVRKEGPTPSCSVVQE